MDKLNWDDLQLFLVAHEQGSFSAAARALCTEQSTISRRIKRLEQALGEPLFLRGRGGLVLTEQGEQALPIAREARARIKEVGELCNPRVQGRVRLAVTETMAMFGVIPHLPALYEQHPDLELELVTGVSVRDLTRREADLALRFVAPTQGDLVYKRLLDLSLGLWGHRDLPAKPPWIALDLGPIPTPEAEWMRSLAPQPPRLRCTSYGSLLAALRSGLGLSVITDVLGARFPELKRYPSPVDGALPLYLVGHAASRHTPRVAAVWAFLEQLVWRENTRAAQLTVG